MEASKRSAKFYVVYWLSVAAMFALSMAIVAFTPQQQAHAAELSAGTPALTTQATVTTQATKAPYKDATAKWVGKSTMKSIAFVKNHGGYKGVIKGTKFHPYKNATRAEFVKILKNLYGKKVPTAGATGKSGKKVLTDKWAKAKMVSTAKNVFGMKIYWGDGSSKKLGRATTANYLWTFTHFDKAFMPKK